MKKQRILFLSNPIEARALASEREARAIQAELERGGGRDCFEFVTRWAAEPLDLLRDLRRVKPTVVHFCGDSDEAMAVDRPPCQPPLRDVGVLAADDLEQRRGPMFRRVDGKPVAISTAALEETFSASGASVKLVVFNGCYSEVQAEALLAHVDCVVGIGGGTSEDVARSFAIGFYGGLGERESVLTAYRQGKAAISLEALRDADRPQLKARQGVDADQIFLVGDGLREVKGHRDR